MFKSEKGTEYVGIRNYTSSKDEISNQTLNAGISVLNAKKLDLKSLQAMSIENLYEIADDKKIDRSIADKAIAALLISELKNVSKEKENRTAASQAQTDAYTYINKGMKIHKESGVLYVCGFVENKEVLKEGIYKTVNSADLTIMKNAIKKALKFKMLKYRNFVFKNADSYKIAGNEIIMK